MVSWWKIALGGGITAIMSEFVASFFDASLAALFAGLSIGVMGAYLTILWACD